MSIVGAQVSGILNLHTRSVTCFVEKAMTWDTPSACVLLGAYVRKRAVVILHVVSQVEKEKYSDENLKKKNNKKRKEIRPPDMPQCPTGAMELFSEFESCAGSGRCGG